MLDIGVVLQAPMEDEEWLKKCALMGLLTFALMLIPIVGAFLGTFNALGWTRAYAEARMRDEKALPPVNMSYVGAGGRMFLSFLPMVGVMVLVLGVVAAVVAVGAATESEPVIITAVVVGSLAFVPFLLWVTVFNPAIIYLHIVKDDPWASARVGRQWALVKSTGTEYLLLWIAFLLCNAVTQLGVLAFGVGLIVSMTYGYAMQGAAIAEFARTTSGAATRSGATKSVATKSAG